MRRSHTLPNTREIEQQQQQHDQQQQHYEDLQFELPLDNNDEDEAEPQTLTVDEGAAIVRNIASFLTLSDAQSMASFVLDENTTNTHNMMNQHHMTTTHQRRQQQHHHHHHHRDNDSWAVGEEIDTGSSSVSLDDGGYWDEDVVATPLTPALIAVSPGATPHHHHHASHHHAAEQSMMYSTEQHPADHAAGLFYGNGNMETTTTTKPAAATKRYNHRDMEEDFEEKPLHSSPSADSFHMQEILQERRRKWAQEKLAAAVYSHPGSLRSFCLQAYQAAQEIKQQQEKELEEQLLLASEEEQEEGDDAAVGIRTGGQKQMILRHRRKQNNKHLLQQLVDLVLHNMPLVLLIDVVEAVGETFCDTIFAEFRLVQKSLNAVVSALGHVISSMGNAILNFNPFQLLEVIVSLQFNAMGRTSEVLVGGIQSVATGVGSASSLALHRLSAANLSVSGTANNNNNSGNYRSLSAASLLGDGSIRGRSSSRHSHHHNRSNNNSLVLNKKLLKKLSNINDAARVVKYTEMGDDTGGLTKQARTKVQRMMHYDVSLRPFVATVEKINTPTAAATVDAAAPTASSLESPMKRRRENSTSSFADMQSIDGGGSPNTTATATGSPFMCSPQSFPPTPHSRATLIARGNKFSDDIVFLARDQLRLHGNLESENEKTREMSKLLREGKRLAVFNAKDAAHGIDFSCGQHIARKAGNMLYCSTRSMVPVLRNCFVYFEITVLPRSVGNVVLQPSMTTLSIGLSTSEMPPNTLVGAWQGSVGLCTTGQLLTAGQWCAPCANPSLCAYGDSATVGCLVCLDDGSAVDTWEGLLVTAIVTFNVNGVIVAPPVASLPIPGVTSAAALPPNVGMNSSLMNHTGQRGTATSTTTTANISTAGSTPPRAASSSLSPTLSPSHSSSTPQQQQQQQHHLATLPLLVPAAEELYPTVTLHSPTTAVMCRFSAEDIVAESRMTIGAPEGVTVYAVDGSVLFGGGGESS